ncbi:MAG: hypothetical protein JXX28_16005 [Deltaproteobacteria bacterium]|nr:hypothetical protein [Deltaproteobacteria bacterium]
MRLLILPLLLAACSRPPDAPENLEEISAWIFTHHGDEEPAALSQALDNLGPLLNANVDAVREGFQVVGLPQEAVEALSPDEVHTAAGILGVSTALLSAFPLDDNAYAQLAVDQALIHPDTYLAYARDYQGDADAFLAHQDERLSTFEQVTVSLPLGGELEHRTSNQQRWIDTQWGPALVQRSWLPERGEANYEWLEVDEQYYVNLFLPVEGGVWHLQTSWMVNDQDLIPDATLLSQMVDLMYDLAEGLEGWLAGPTR